MEYNSFSTSKYLLSPIKFYASLWAEHFDMSFNTCCTEISVLISTFAYKAIQVKIK